MDILILIVQINDIFVLVRNTYKDTQLKLT